MVALCQASLVAQTVKNPPAMQEIRFNPWVRKIPWESACLRIYMPGEPNR